MSAGLGALPMGWSVHATIGAIFLAGAIGLLVSILSHPPELPESEHRG